MVAVTTEVRVIRRSRHFVDVNHGGDRFRITSSLAWFIIARDEDGDYCKPADYSTGLTKNQRKLIAMRLVTNYQIIGGEWRRCFDLPAVC